ETQPAAEKTLAEEADTARATRCPVSHDAQDVLDVLTLISMLGVYPVVFVHKMVLAVLVESDPITTRKQGTKKANKKTAAKKATKKTTKKANKKTAAKKSTKKTTAKKTSS